MASSRSHRDAQSPRPNNVSNFGQFLAASGHCGQSKQKTEIGRSVQLTQPPVRIMASGRCTKIITVGDYEYSCQCPYGVFDAPISTLEVQCKKCTHTLVLHEDVSLDPASHSSQSKLPITGSPINNTVRLLIDFVRTFQERLQSYCLMRSPTHSCLCANIL
jgi:hypothetical protein